MRVQNLVHVPLRCDAVAASRTQDLEDDGSQHLVVADGAPQHEAGPAPGVVFHDTVVSIAVTSSSPYPNTLVGMVNAETAFIAEKHVLPANIVPVGVALRPLQACLSMAHGANINPTSVGTTTSPPCLQYRDVIVVTRSDELREETRDVRERRIVVWLPGRAQEDDNNGYTDDDVEALDRLHLMSRCSTQLVIVDVPL
nr:hypothetical protein BaRGS_019206 [Batillaria attramentaria]